MGIVPENGVGRKNNMITNMFFSILAEEPGTEKDSTKIKKDVPKKSKEEGSNLLSSSEDEGK
jgi:hypothetical protein